MDAQACRPGRLRCADATPPSRRCRRTQTCRDRSRTVRPQSSRWLEHSPLPEAAVPPPPHPPVCRTTAELQPHVTLSVPSLHTTDSRTHHLEETLPVLCGSLSRTNTNWGS